MEIHAVDLHMYSTYELVDLQFSCGIGVEHWISTCGLCNQGLEPHLESGAPHSPFVTPSPLVHFFFYRTSTVLSTFVGVPLLQQNVRGVTLGGGLPPPPGVTLQQSGPGTVLGGGMPPGVTLQQSEPGIVRMEECPPALRYSRAALYNSVLPPREQVHIYLY